MLKYRSSNDLPLKLENLLAFEGVANSPIEQGARHSFISGFLSNYNCLTENGEFVLPPVDCACINFKEACEFVVSRSQLAKLLSLLGEFWLKARWSAAPSLNGSALCGSPLLRSEGFWIGFSPRFDLRGSGGLHVDISANGINYPALSIMGREKEVGGETFEFDHGCFT